MTVKILSDFFSHAFSSNTLLNFSEFNLLICKMGLLVDAGLLRELKKYQKASSGFKCVTQRSLLSLVQTEGRSRALRKS